MGFRRERNRCNPILVQTLFYLKIQTVSPPHPPRLLELSLPKFSMSAVTDLRDLLTNMDPEIEAKLLGSQAEFSKLSNTKPFTIDKVN